jgi:multidrug transporter EmrE-like cation transporter
MLGAFVTTSELALVVLSAFLHAIWSASIKGSRNPLGFNLLQLVPPVAAACLLPFWVPLADIPRAVWWIAIGTGVSHGLYFYWMARALASGELSVVYPIARSAPAFLPLVAVLLLGESGTARGALGIAIVVAGMWAVQADSGVAGWQRFRAPGAKFAWLSLLASIGYSLCDKAAMAHMNAAPWHPRFRPPSSTTCPVGHGGLVFTPLALRVSRGVGGLAQQVAQASCRGRATRATG